MKQLISKIIKITFVVCPLLISTLRFTDANGKVILDKTWSKNQKSIKIDLNSYPPGIYYCHLIHDKKSIETHKIILTK